MPEIDKELMRKLYGQARSGNAGTSGRIEPIPVDDSTRFSEETKRKYIDLGERIIAEGRFAAVTMAGGQGTRLGHPGPKGTFDIGTPEGSLFGIQAARLKRRSDAAGRRIPWYIMTSEENNDETVAFFEKNGYFGYGSENVRFFTQFMLPMLDFNGDPVFDRPGHMKLGADGHGGIFRAMHAKGITAEMKAKGIEYVFIGGIDNVLVKLCDPLFIGYIAANGYPCAGKSLIKRDAFEKAGVFCLRDGRPYVVEYTEISEEMARAEDENGQFLYGDLHILCNIFRIDAVEAAGSGGLPYHTAVKKTQYVDADGNVVTPDAPNAYKFEAFIFDVFSSYEKMGVMRVRREDEFAPVKNREGEDSPETAAELYRSAELRGKLD